MLLSNNDTSDAPYGDYYPSELEDLIIEAEDAYINRSDRIDYPEKSVPKGWPAQHPPSQIVWTAETFPKDGSQFLKLSEADVVEIEEALQYVEEACLQPGDINKAAFPLPNLGKRLEAACESVHSGIGISIVKGIPSGKYTPQQNVSILAGISAYFGEMRGRQRDDGSKLIHIFNSSTRRSINNQAPIFASYGQGFHNDIATDILCMYCLHPASQSGGSNSFASIPALYNILAKEHPEVIHTLAAPDWPWDSYGYNPPYHMRPLMFWSDGTENDDEDDGDKTPTTNTAPRGHVITSLSPRQLAGTISQPRHPSLPKITERQQQALDLIETLAQKHCITYTLAAGEIVFVNNLAVLHNRSAYRDSQDVPASEHRHLVRMFLRNDELAWPTPRALQLDWARVFGGYEDEELWLIDLLKDDTVGQKGRWYNGPTEENPSKGDLAA